MWAGRGWKVMVFALGKLEHVLPAPVLSSYAQNQVDPVVDEDRECF